ncbi:MAG: hypothetical protein E7291_07415 [Lachnospiraceae bacterium]|nr:hypothetical protein [Lachnospiraceae bacterium]
MGKKIWGMILFLMLTGTMVACGYEGKDRIHEEKQVLSVETMEKQELSVENTKENTEDFGKTAEAAIPRMVRIDGEIYYDTGVISNELRCGVMDGEIISHVATHETPTEDEQSNFGDGFGYQRCGHGVIHINIDGEWCIFQSGEAYRLTVTNGNSGEMIEMERSPEFWSIIEKYNALSVGEDENQTPRVGYQYCLRLYDREDNLLSTVTPTGQIVNVDGVYYRDSGYGTVNELFLILDSLFSEELPEASISQVAADEVDMTDGVSMYVTYATDKGANLVFYNYSDKDMQFGDDYELHMRRGDEWYKVDYVIDNWAFHDIAYMMPQNEPISWSVKWTYFHGTLAPGQYRIVKEVIDYRAPGDYTKYKLGAEFVVE